MNILGHPVYKEYINQFQDQGIQTLEVNFCGMPREILEDKKTLTVSFYIKFNVYN